MERMIKMLYDSIISSHYSSSKYAYRQRKLIRSLDKNYDEIISSYEYINRELDGKRELVPAAEWLLDNVYLIEKEYKDIKYITSRDYFKNLPVIDNGIMEGYPRIYSIAEEIISHSDGRISEDEIETFINEYQKNTILLTGELWALPVMLRIVIIHNISKVVSGILFSVKEKSKGGKAC
jgi:cyclic beta-1,2-glucan synthetase